LACGPRLRARTRGEHESGRAWRLPEKLNDILAPKWAGKIVWRPNNLPVRPASSAISCSAWAKSRAWISCASSPSSAIISLQTSDRAVLDQVIAGEYAMALAMTNHNVEISRKDGAPVQWLPLEPTIISPSRWA
jgi:iron(III) transport system substrate-binding protein